MSVRVQEDVYVHPDLELQTYICSLLMVITRRNIWTFRPFFTDIKKTAGALTETLQALQG